MAASPVPRTEELAAFHDVGRLFPTEVTVVSVSPDTPAIEAIKTMREHGYSQVPVVDGQRVLGVLSLWSLASHVVNAPRLGLEMVSAVDLVQNVRTVTVEDSLHSVLDALQEQEVLLVISPRGVQAVITHSDVLKYLYRVARPFALLQETELALRVIIDCCLPGDELAPAIERVLGRYYRDKLDRPVPTRLVDLSFQDHVTLIDSKMYEKFEPVLGKARVMVAMRLKQVSSLRNDVFHFRRDLTIADHENLVLSRDWLSRRMRRAGIIARDANAE